MMETYNGVLSLRLMNEGSKSEGVFAYLTLESGDEYMLCRQDVFPADDEYFVPFGGKAVCVKGELYTDELVVEEIQIAESSAVAENATVQKSQGATSKKAQPRSPKRRKPQHLTLYSLMKSRKV